MNDDCYCDYDGDNPCLAVIESTNRKCRKPRRCCECRTMIQKGERYAFFCGVWEESGKTSYATCLKCEDLRKRCAFACAPFEGIINVLRDEYIKSDIEIEAFLARRERALSNTMKA